MALIIKLAAFLYLCCFIASFVVYLIYEKNIFDKWVELCISMAVGIFFAFLFAYSYQKEDMITPLLVLFLPVVFIVFYYTSYDTNMLSPMTFGFTAGVSNNWTFNFS